MSSDRSLDPGFEHRNEHDERVEQIVGDYIDRLNRGEIVSTRDVLDAHPALGKEIVEYLGSFIDLDPPAPEPLRTLGDYTLRRQIGRGGMGVVYEAWENSMDRAVALKVLPPGVAVDDKAFGRFMREARSAGRLSHPNVVSVHSMGQVENTPYYAMEYVEGETLSQVLRRWKEAEEGAETVFGAKDEVAYFHNMAKAFADVADGLQHAHSRGIIHRDIKPSNLILEAEVDPEADPEADRGGRAKPERSGGLRSPKPERSGGLGNPKSERSGGRPLRLRILDFGLARLEGQESVTLSGDLVGTPAYMSPEQARRQKIPVDHRTDIYSLGATLYELLTGQQPFRGTDYNDTLSQIIERDPRSPRQANPRVPQDLETIVLKCLRKDSGDRFATAEALEQDLRRFVRGDPIEAREESVAERLTRRLRRHRRGVASAGLVLLVILLSVLLGSALLWREQRKTRAALEVSRWQTYVASVTAAALDLENGGGLLARENLEKCPEELRGWEWRHLHLQLDVSLEVTRQDDAEPIWSLSLSPDGKRFVTGSGVRWGHPGSVGIRDTDSRKLLRTFDGHSRGVSVVAFSPGGEYVASASVDETARIWSVASGEVIATLKHELLEGEDRVFPEAAVWSPDGKRLATGTGHPGDWQAQGAVRFWDTETWKLVRAECLNSGVTSLAFSPDGRALAVGCYGAPLRLLEASSGRSIAELAPHRPGARAITIRPDGRRVAAGFQDGVVRLWDAGSFELVMVLTGHEKAVRTLAFSADGRRLFSGSRDHTLRVWDAESGKMLAVLRGHEHEVTAVVPCPDGRLLSAARDGSIRLWDSGSSGGVTTLRGHEGSVDCVGFSPAGERVLSASGDRTVRVWDASTGRPLVELPHPDYVRAASFSPGGRQIASGADDGVIRLWNAATSELVRAYSPDGVRSRVYRVAFSSDGGRLASGSSSGVATIQDLTLDSPVTGLQHDSTVNSLEFSRDDERLLTGSEGGLVRLWNARTGELIATLRGHRDGVSAVTFSPDGDRIVSSSWDRTVRLWDAATLESLVLRGHAEEVAAVGFSPDGSRIVSADGSGELRLWDARRGAAIAGLSGHGGVFINSVAFSPDGQRLVSAGADHTIAVWETELSSLRRMSKQTTATE